MLLPSVTQKFIKLGCVRYHTHLFNAGLFRPLVNVANGHQDRILQLFVAKLFHTQRVLQMTQKERKGELRVRVPLRPEEQGLGKRGQQAPLDFGKLRDLAIVHPVISGGTYHINRPYRQGWQLVSLKAPAVEART